MNATYGIFLPVGIYYLYANGGMSHDTKIGTYKFGHDGSRIPPNASGPIQKFPG
ncbi:hypothetical protein NDK43_08970 [Neobacillus pocheonensis]|uniref:Uncharacterized protein n=1 Tax=Neobacillus pocheonensis TaxID=363869 RepID=A0ABT0W8U2_9BACI|nr:hypothetical protein [Neobacillus pocheonensis]